MNNVTDAVVAKENLVPTDHGFLRIAGETELFVDTRNGELYSQMPELVRFGNFEIASIGGYLCTRTKRLYEVKANPALVWLGKYGLYLTLPYDGEPEDEIRRRIAVKPERYEVCLLNGDESGVYWLLRVFEDESLVVMTDEGVYFHVRRSVKTCRALKRRLGRVDDENEKAEMLDAVRQIEVRIANRLRREAAKAKREAEKERERQIAILISVEPFKIGDKWGLRKKGRIVVPPIYRLVKNPVGRYCAFEMNPGQWGVMAVDGKVEVEPRFEDVFIHPNGLVELTVRRGKVITRRLK